MVSGARVPGTTSHFDHPHTCHDMPTTLEQLVSEITDEVKRATEKFPTWPTDPLHALAILGEEYGELNREMLQLVYEPHKTNSAKVRQEAIQTAAMALRLLLSLDKYQYQPSTQHQQPKQ